MLSRVSIGSNDLKAISSCLLKPLNGKVRRARGHVFGTFASVCRVSKPPFKGMPGTSSLVVPTKPLSISISSKPRDSFPNSLKASSNLSRSDSSEDPSSLLRPELDAELELSHSAELSGSTLTSPEPTAASLARLSSSLLRLTLLAGGASCREPYVQGVHQAHRSKPTSESSEGTALLQRFTLIYLWLLLLKDTRTFL